MVKVCKKIASTTLNDLRDPNKFSSPKKAESILADPVQPLEGKFMLLLPGLRYNGHLFKEHLLLL